MEALPGALAMAGRPSEPWFYSDKGTWYIWLDGKKKSLGVRGEGNKAEAVKAWHRLMAGVPLDGDATASSPSPKATPKHEDKPDALTVKGMVEAFLADCEGRLKPATVRWYSDMLTPFAEAKGAERVDAITAKVAMAYAKKPRWSDSTRNGILSALSIAFRWAGHPLAGLKKPTMQSRGSKALISDADHAQLMAKAPAYFKPFLTVCRLTGARPGEVAAITSENFDEGQGVVVLGQHKTAHRTGKERLIFLPPEAVALLVAQRALHGEGHLLRDRQGQPYGKDAIVGMMRRLRRKAGVKGTAYGYRHTLATDALASGIPDAHVAALLGHQGTTMLHRHYSHLTERAGVLREALGQVRGAKDEPKG